MTGPEDVVRWLRQGAGRCAWAAAEVERIARRVERAWADERGREWAERAGVVRGRLARDAALCRELAERLAAGAGPEQQAGPGTGAGPVLGVAAGRRVDAARGVRIAVLTSEDRGVADR